MSENDILTRLNSITDYIRSAEAKATRGEIVDLSGLDKTVGEICAAVENAEPKIAKETEPHLARLISNLDSLGQALQTQVENQKEEA